MYHSKQTKGINPASGEMLLTLLETLPDALFLIDNTETIVYANMRARTITGTSPKACFGKSFWRCAPHLVSTSLYQAMHKTKQTRILTDVEYISPVTQTWLYVQISPTVEGLMLQFHEARESVRHQQMFPQGERLSIYDLDGLHTWIWTLTPEGILLEINAIPLNDAQVGREEVIGKPLAETPWWSFSPASQKQLRAAITRASTGETVRFEALIRPRVAMNLHLEGVITPHMDAGHHIEYLVIVGIDITARKQAERETHALIDAVPQLVWTGRSDGYIDSCNQRWCDYTGMIKGVDGWLQAVHPDDYGHTLTAWRHAWISGEPFEIEYRLKNGQTGAYRWFLARALPVHDETGQISTWFGTCTDIHDQKRTKEALRQGQECVNALMLSNILGIYIAKGEKIIEANETFLHMTGYSQEDLQHGHLNCLDMTAPEYLTITRQAHKEIALHSYVTPYEKEYIGKDGSRVPVVVGGVATHVNPLQEIIFVQDNSARKELEQRKDDFINMASHELRNPLSALKLQIQLVRKRLERQSDHNTAIALSRVEGPIRQLERLIGELLDISKIQAGRLEYRQEMVDLDALLWENVETMQSIYPSHTLVVRSAVQISLMADRDRLGQVFINLISNAVKYSPDAKTVEIDMGTSPETVTIRVHDYGLGIPREQHKKIFERFYRTSDSKQRAIPGLGMGLYIVAEIIKYHGGIIGVDSEVEKGTTFTVTLPRTRDTSV